MNDDLFNYLVATDELDDFLGYEPKCPNCGSKLLEIVYGMPDSETGEKATTIIDGITYHKTENRFDNDIFTINNVRGELGENAIDVKKHIYDFLVTDSKNEREFAKKLESGEVTVYAKLPNGFKIPTPVGNYNPDWAIVFDNPSFKYIYFIAETKGSMDSLELRDVEKAKIECAKKHFKCISNDEVKYDVVDSYESLINLLTA